MDLGGKTPKISPRNTPDWLGISFRSQMNKLPRISKLHEIYTMYGSEYHLKLFHVLRIKNRSDNNFDQSAFSNSKLSEDVLQLEVEGQLLSCMWGRFLFKWDGNIWCE